jgi:N-dimethylarginine dimethylaminohydrolase
MVLYYQAVANITSAWNGECGMEEPPQSMESLKMSLRHTAHYYHEVLKRLPPQAEPAFEDPAMQERVWGQCWGVANDVGQLRLVLLHRPGEEMTIMTPDRYDPEIEALVDDAEQWYWRDERGPDLARLQVEHDQLAEILRAAGARVEYIGGPPRNPKAMYTRDAAIAVRGGAIVCRMGVVGRFPGTGRRGEEAWITRKLVELGMPILRTIHGTGLAEGGSFCWLTPTTAAIGMSHRQNAEGVRQIEEVLTTLGVQLLHVPLVGHGLHLDEALVMVDHHTALINSTHLPYWLPETIQRLDIRLIEMHYQDSPSVVNCLALRPGTVVLAINNGTGTAERLEKAGITVIPIDFSESQRNGGGIHCATLPLVRAWDDT